MSSNNEKGIIISSKIPFIVRNTNSEINHQYTLKIVIESLIWLKSLPNYDITISFCNPVLQTFYTIPDPIKVKRLERIYLENIECRMNLEIPSEQVPEMFGKWSPTLFFCTTDNTVLSHCDLNLKDFKFKKSTEKIFMTVSLRDAIYDTEKVGEINIILTMYDNKIKVTNPDLAYIGVPAFFKISDQLDKWKESQMTLFKKQEERRINVLIDNWKREKYKLQNRLVQNIQDTNNLLEKLRTERNSLKEVVDSQISKKDVKLPDEEKLNIIKEEIESKPFIIRRQAKQLKDTKEFKELKTVIKKQTDEIKSLQEKCKNIEEFQKMRDLVDKLRIKICLKDQEIEYLKQKWAIAVRELNTYRRREMELAKQKHKLAHKEHLPLMIQEYLKIDESEQQRDLEQLRSIRRELREHKKERNKIEQEKENYENDVNTLLKTKTYSKNDRVIKLLDRKDKDRKDTDRKDTDGRDIDRRNIDLRDIDRRDTDRRDMVQDMDRKDKGRKVTDQKKKNSKGKKIRFAISTKK